MMWDPEDTPGLGPGFVPGFVMGASCCATVFMCALVLVLWVF